MFTVQYGAKPGAISGGKMFRVVGLERTGEGKSAHESGYIQISM